MVKKYLPITIVIIVAIFAARYLLLPGFVPTHDGEYHIIRFWQFDKVFRTGNIIPRWAPDLNQGKGVPLFAFFYPLPNYIAEVFILLGFSYVKTLHLVLASGLVFSGIAFYFWMSSFFRPWPSALGAIFYILAPYHLVDVFIRGSVGEVWALALAPFVFYLTTEIIKNQQTTNSKQQTADSRYFFWNSISLFLLLLSHNILGPLFFVFGIVYGIFLAFKHRFSMPIDSLRSPAGEAGKTLGVLYSYTIGFLLSSFFWIPIYFEKQHITGLDIVNYKEHFPALYQLLIPSWGTGFSGASILADQMSFQIGIPHLFVLFGGILIFLARERKNVLVVFFLLVFSGTVILMLEWSLIIWDFLPFMQYFQYPWRLLSVVILVTSFFASFLASKRSRITVPILLLSVILFYTSYTKPVVYPSRKDSFYLNNPIWTEGTATLGNSFNVKESSMLVKLENSKVRTVANSITLLTGLLLVIIVKRR